MASEVPAGSLVEAAGALDREHFLDAQRRHRRRTWQAAALGLPAVMVSGIPLCIIITPILLAPLIVIFLLLDNLGTLPPGFGEWVYRAAHILPDTWSAIWSGTRVSTALVLAAFVLPGAITMLLLWLALRVLLGKAWIQTVLIRLGGRPPDRRRLTEKMLCNIAEEMAVAAAVGPPRILLIDSKKANAAVIGHGSEEAILLVSIGLLETLDRAETQALIAHLIASIGHGDLRIAATFFAMFEAWGALALMIETPFNPEARSTLRRLGRALSAAVRGEADPRESGEVADALIEGAAIESKGFDRYMDRIETEWAPLRQLLVDLPIMITACIFAITARAAIALSTNLLFGPPMSALWRSRRRLADAAAVELTRQPAALAAAVEKLHEADVALPGGEPVSFIFPVWPKTELTLDRSDVTSCILGMQLDPHKRLQGLRRLGSGRRVTIELGGWEGWRREIRDIPALLGAFVLALLLIGGLLVVTFAEMGALLLLLWSLLELALVTLPNWLAGLF